MTEKVFISYNHKDKSLVDQITRRLEIEFGRNNIFYDVWSIQPGDSIIGKMNEGLSEFTTFFFFLSPNSLKSKMVSLEWQTALNRAVNLDLKFVAVRIAECAPPVILSDKMYIDLYGEGLDSSVEKMKCIVKGDNTYRPLEEIQNLKSVYKAIDSKTMRFTIEAVYYSEHNPVFAFACSNSLNEFSVCFNISDGMTVCGKDEITVEDDIVLNARTVQLQRALRPGFPFTFEVTLNGVASLHNVAIYILVDAIKRCYHGIPIESE